MKRFFRTSVCKDTISGAMVICILLILFLRTEGMFRFIYPLPALIYCRMRTRNTAWIGLALFMLLCIIPRGRDGIPDFHEGIVVHSTEHYGEVIHHGYRVRLYSEDLLPLDATIRFDADWNRIEPVYGFYTADSSRTAHEKGIYYSGRITHWEVLKERPTARRLLQRSIECHRDRALLLRILLGIRTDDLDIHGFLLDSGLSFAGVLLALNRLLNYIMTEDKRGTTMLIVTALLGLIYRFPFVLLQSFIYRLMRKTGLSRGNRLALSSIISLCLVPAAVDAPAFWIPFIYRFVRIYTEHKHIGMWNAGMIMQSLLFRSINPVSALLYPYTTFCCGILYGVGLLSLLCPYLSAERIFIGADRCLSLFNGFRIPGSVLGFGLPVYLLLVWFLRKHKHHVLMSAVFLIVFQYLGFFHPFAEVTFVNVGQGDAMVIREPLNRCSIIIDTGKPSAYRRLQNFLDAKGIRHVNTLFITHNDNDHSGNAAAIERDYSPKQTITEHFDSMTPGSITFYDLNDINDDNENRSSLVHCFRMNGLTYLCMGDADYDTEERISRRFSRLTADVLKVSHHGSATGSSQLFLETVKPHLAIISCGSYRIYHHPSSEVLTRLKNNRIPYLDTRSQGDITIVCLPGINLLLTSAGRFAFLKPSV